MKVLKMHDNADEKFDRFVKEQLDKTDVDMALADTYFAQMQLPAAQQAPPAKRKLRWFFIWFSVVCLVAITAHLFVPTDKKAPAVLPNSSAQAPNQPMPSQPGVPAMASDGDEDRATTTGPAAKQATVMAKPIDKDQINGILTNDRAAIKQTALSVDTVERTISNKTEQLITLKDTMHIQMAKRDSALKPLRAAVMPQGPKDSVYIVW